MCIRKCIVGLSSCHDPLSKFTVSKGEVNDATFGLYENAATSIESFVFFISASYKSVKIRSVMRKYGHCFHPFTEILH